MPRYPMHLAKRKIGSCCARRHGADVLGSWHLWNVWAHLAVQGTLALCGCDASAVLQRKPSCQCLLPCQAEALS